MGIKQCVEFVLNERTFALPLENVKEIISRPEITPLPMASRHVQGMINLRGDVIPVVDLDVRLGGTSDLRKREDILIIDLNGLNAGILVDSASQVSELDLGDIEEPSDEDLGFDKSAVTGVVRHGDKLVVMLDAAKILSIDREILNRMSSEKKYENVEKRSTERLRIVTFDLGGDTYGFRLEEVREILRYNEPVSVPDSPDFVKGVLQIRGSILPVVSLKDRLKRAGDFIAEKAKILVADYGDYRIGFIADAIKEVLEIPLSEMSEPPSIVQAGGEKESISAIVNHDDCIVTILNKDGLVDQNRLREMASEENDTRMDTDLTEKTETFVVFQVAGQPFGLPITGIREITRVGNLSEMPAMPDFVEGVLNIRGDVIPAVNVRKRLRMKGEVPFSEDGRVLVVEMDDSLLGLMVDDVTGVMEIPYSHMSETPKSMKDLGSAREFVSKIAKVEEEGKMLLILKPESVISYSEITALAGAAE